MKELPRTHAGPGLVDIHLNGYAGFDFNGDPAGWTRQDLLRVAGALERRGVLAVFPTLITDDPRAMVDRARRYAQLLAGDAELAAHFPRLHVEGPFISPEEGPRGAHPRPHCLLPKDAPDLIDRLREAAAGRIGIVTLTPELPGAMELIQRCTAAGILVAIGHTQASAGTIDEAVAAGARMSTHLGNGSHQMLPRVDNYVQTQLADDRLWASFIADGHHIPLTTLKNFLRAKTPARSILVTDAIVATGLGPGKYPAGTKIVEVHDDGRTSAPGAPALAGSVLTLDKAVVNVALHCGVPFAEAWAMASTNPASLLSLPCPPQVSVTITPRGFRA